MRKMHGQGSPFCVFVPCPESRPSLSPIPTVAQPAMSDPTSPARIEDPVQKMNRMYRWTRHVYDATRRYYLLGRDRMLDTIADRPAGAVLEVGCGTARNLRVLAEKAPQHRLYGIDASLAMLATARDKLEKTGHDEKIGLAQGLAQELDPEDRLGVEGPFDVIFFSYVLSMIPSWPSALNAAFSHLAPDGRLYVLDFWDQANLPPPAGRMLRSWLRLFDVVPRSDLLRTLQRLDQHGRLSCSIAPIAHRYAFLATVAPPPCFRLPSRTEEARPNASSKRFASEEVIPT